MSIWLKSIWRNSAQARNGPLRRGTTGLQAKALCLDWCEWHWTHESDAPGVDWARVNTNCRTARSSSKAFWSDSSEDNGMAWRTSR
mmetsp:Transcript_16332/g.33841  ORF Transcript_16332/g.33841 Transcript_16332/m.33841 type:complete len:86 (-) Transcript_16332:97-354(-)